jgi:hypothetical protein
MRTFCTWDASSPSVDRKGRPLRTNRGAPRSAFPVNKAPDGVGNLTLTVLYGRSAGPDVLGEFDSGSDDSFAPGLLGAHARLVSCALIDHEAVQIAA